MLQIDMDSKNYENLVMALYNVVLMWIQCAHCYKLPIDMYIINAPKLF